jgi:hypothetical protein
MADAMHQVSFHDGDVIVRQGELGSEFYAIVSGEVVCTVRKNPDNEVRILYIPLPALPTIEPNKHRQSFSWTVVRRAIPVFEDARCVRVFLWPSFLFKSALATNLLRDIAQK